eukprot:1491596-Amphidinium_carterae.1
MAAASHMLIDGLLRLGASIKSVTSLLCCETKLQLAFIWGTCQHEGLENVKVRPQEGPVVFDVRNSRRHV